MRANCVSNGDDLQLPLLRPTELVGKDHPACVCELRHLPAVCFDGEITPVTRQKRIARPRLPSGLVVVGLAWLVLAGCSSEIAVPLDELPTPTTPGTPHQLEPTEQMRQLARQQCLDDPTLDHGEVNAVDPDNPDLVLASVVIDCSTVG